MARMNKPRGALLIAFAAATCTVLALGATGAFGGSGSDAGSAPVVAEHVNPAPNAAVVTHAIQESDGQIWSVKTYENAAGKLCFAEQIPGEGQGIGCLAPGEAFRDGPVWFGVGARQSDDVDLTEWDSIWVDGLVSDDVAALELVMTDCSTRQVAFDDDGVFLALVSKSDIAGDVWPHRLVARDQGGGVLLDESVALDPPSTDAARAAGTTAPVAKGC